MKSQNDRLLREMKNGASFTPFSAAAQLGISRLSARIYDIKKLGEPVVDEFVEVQNKYGETCRVKRFWLARQP